MRPREKTSLVERTMMSVTSVPKYTCRLDFTTGKQVDRGDKLLRKCKAVALANELERTRRVRGISQVTPLGWLQMIFPRGSGVWSSIKTRVLRNKDHTS